MRRTVRRYLCGAGAATAVVVAGLVGCALLSPPIGALHSSLEVATGGCTIFTVSQGDKVLFGSNADWNDPETRYWVTPGFGDGYDALLVGFDNLWPQGGINEKGLCFNGNLLPSAPLNPHHELPVSPTYVPLLMLQSCATVEEAIELAKQYSWGLFLRKQLHFADVTGDAVVIGAGPDGELAFTRKEPGDSFLVSTNYNLANPANGGPDCWRYDTAVEMLSQLGEDELTVEFCRDVLDACHLEGDFRTLYSCVFDPVSSGLHFWYLHQFYERATFDSEDMFSQGQAVHEIRDLFSEETAKAGDASVSRAGGSVASNVALGLLGVAAIACVVFAYVRDARKTPK